MALTVPALKALSTPVRTGVIEAMRLHLTRAPAKLSKSRTKRLRGLSQPQYRLRVDDIRVFYDITETQIHVVDPQPRVLLVRSELEREARLELERSPSAGIMPFAKGAA